MLLYFIKDQAILKEHIPKIINIFSFAVKFNEFLKKITYMRIKEVVNKGINFEVTRTKIYLYFFELNKYLMPTYAFNESIEDI